MDKAKPIIALVICTRNRAHKLDAFLESLQRIQCRSSWELVIVNNGSNDHTSERLKLFTAGFRNPVILVTEPTAGLGRARNRGWRATLASIIAFTDDDCYPEPDYLDAVLTVFEDESVGFSGGRTLLYDRSDAPITIYEHPTEQTYAPNHFIVGGVIHGANMAFRRQALVDINGFDDHLGAGTPFAFEDVDAQLRALAAGWTGRYSPRPLVYHHHGRKPGRDVEQLNQSYETGRGGYYMKCLLYLPHRWECFRYWSRDIRRQSFVQTVREIKAAIRYFFYQLKQKPNTSY